MSAVFKKCSGWYLNGSSLIQPASGTCSTDYFHPGLKGSNQGNLWPDLWVDEVAPHEKHVLEGAQKGFEITEGILAFVRESLWNCFLTVLVLPTTKISNMVAFPKGILQTPVQEVSVWS